MDTSKGMKAMKAKSRARMRRTLRGLGGAVLTAALLWLMLAAPGLLTDGASTVPAHRLEARR